MNTFGKSILVIALFMLCSFAMHKYYISFTKINYVEDSKSLQIISRIFIDDLENSLNTQFKIDTKLHTKSEIENTDTYITEYISDKFFIYINGKKTAYVFLGKKYDEDEIVLYLEIENINTINSLEVKNKLLMELFEDQQNIIKLNINGKKKSLILTKGNDKDLLKF